MFVAVVASLGVSSSLGLTSRSLLRILYQSVVSVVLGVLVLGPGNCITAVWPLSSAVVFSLLCSILVGG